MADWFARPVLHVSSVEASLRFYVDALGFTVAWRYEQDGRTFVAQVDRGSCALRAALHGTGWRRRADLNR
jgi:catechol 2,3-dioxygenase-like lactoylglutathione lyase family enzyme